MVDPLERAHLSDVRPAGRTSFFARLNGKQVFLKPAPGDAGRLQLLADRLKPIFGLRSMGTRLRQARLTGDGRQLAEAAEASTWIVCRRVAAVALSRRARIEELLNRRFNWRQRDRLVHQYVMIALFRYGTLRFAGLSTRRVLLMRGAGQLLSTGETSVGRESALGRRPLRCVRKYLRQPGNRANVRILIQNWRKVAGIEKDAIRAAVTRCGLPAELAGTLQANLRALRVPPV